MQCWIEIDSDALRHNFESFSRLVGKKRLAPVLKSNAYGHGIVEVYSVLAKLGVENLCVHYVKEARILRQLGFKAKIHIVGNLDTEKHLIEAKNLDAVVTLCTLKAFTAWRNLSDRPQAALKIETGLNRRGFEIAELKRLLTDNETLPEIKALMSHFANVEDVTCLDYAERQLQLLAEATQIMRSAGYRGIESHCASSASTILLTHSHLDMCRVGISCYGLWPSELNRISAYQASCGQSQQFSLRPVLSWRAPILSIQRPRVGSYVGYGCTHRIDNETLTGVLSVGYHEGLPRILSERGAYVLVQGKRCNIIGRICMNMCMLDLKSVAQTVHEGAIATLIGQDGTERITADQLATWSESIHYELVTRLHPEIPRRIISN